MIHFVVQTVISGYHYLMISSGTVQLITCFCGITCLITNDSSQSYEAKLVNICSKCVMSQENYLLCAKNISNNNRSIRRKHSWATRLTPRWHVLDPNYNYICVWHFTIAKEKQEACRPDSLTFWPQKIEVGSYIAKNHSSSLWLSSGHSLPKIICWPKVKVGQLQVKSQI